MSERVGSGIERGRRGALLRLSALLALGSSAARAGDERRIEWADITLIDGRVVRAADLRAQAVVVEMWATWCPFCKKQNPHLQKLHETAGGKGLFVLTFALDKDPKLIRDYQRRHGYTFAAAQASPQVERWFGKRRSLPELYVVDRSGRVVLREYGEMFPEEVAALARFAAGA